MRDSEYEYEDEYEEEPVKHHFFRNLIIVLVIVCALAGGGYVLKNKVRQKVASVVGDQVVEKAAESLGISSEQAQEVLNSMSPEDRQTVTDIVANHMNSSTISEAQQIVKDRDVNEAKEFAQQQLTSEEQEQLKGIAEKYASRYSGQYSDQIEAAKNSLNQ